MIGNNYNHKLPDIEMMKEHYFNDKLSAKEIANIYGVTLGAVLIKFRRYNIKRRSLSESQAIIANYISLEENTVDFINGLLLGDGSLVLSPKKKSCVYSHTDKNKEYLIWLKNEFNKLGIKCSKITNHTNNTWRLKTLYYRDFVELRHEWYPKDKKLIPNIKIKPIILFNWYIGDGCYDKKSKSEKVVICSQFDQAGKIVMSKLMNNIGIKTSIYPEMIYIKKESRDLFFKYILSHNISVPKCYKYKFNI